MKKLISKELREHFKVALIGLGIFIVMLVLAFSACSDALRQAVFSTGYAQAEALQPLLAHSLLTQAAFFCGIFGTVLGWLQIRAEKHPDLWAFLVHRPIPRITILHSKVLSGLLLYAMGAGLPLLGLVIIVSIPGNVAAPFKWAMALPLLAIFLVGVAYYFAGLLTGLRKARWYASQGFGLGLPVLATFAAFTMTEFWQALLIILLAQAVLALAVWGSFRTGGHYREQPVLGKSALTLACTVSVMILFGLLVTLVMNLLSSRGSFTHSQYQLTKDGKVVKITQRGLGDVEIVDLSGKPVLDEKTGQRIKLRDIQQRYATGLSAFVDFDNPTSKRNRYRDGYSSTTRFFRPWRVLDKTLWYLTSDGRLVAYQGITRKLVDSLAPQGSPGVPNDFRFLQPLNYYFRSFQPYEMPVPLPSARTAYLVDVEKRELKPLFTVADDDAIGAYSEQTSHFYPANSNLVLFLTRTSIRVLDFEGQTRLQVPYEPSHSAYPMVSVLRLEPANTFALRFEPDYLLNLKSGGRLLTHIKLLGEDGSVRNAMDLPKLPNPQSESLAEKCLIALAPPAFPFYSWEEGYRAAHILRLVPAILCLGIGWWLGRKNNFSLRARLAWGIFHLLTGLPGLLAFLAVQEWPPKERCSNCTRLRVVNREQCEHCGSAFAPPTKIGIEIFEPLTTN